MTYWLNETKKGENMSQNGLTTVGVNPSKGLQVLGMSINSLTEAMEVAEFFAKSDLVPKDYKNKPGNIVVAWQKGFEVGLMPQQSLETIAVINGRACIWGDGLIALVKRSPMEEWTNEWNEGDGDKMVAFCETKRKDQPKTIKSSFSVEDAKKAGLWGKNTWANYPKRMLQMRARGFALRDAYPDVLNGLQLAEEVLDAQYVTPAHTKEEIETALASIGLNLSIIDGQGVASGEGLYNNSKFLKDVGFSYTNGKWVIPLQDICIDGSLHKAQSLALPQPEPESIDPQKELANAKKALMKVLLGNGLTKEEAGEFAQTLDVSNTDSINKLLPGNGGHDELIAKINAFLTPQSSQTHQGELFGNNEDEANAFE